MGKKQMLTTIVHTGNPPCGTGALHLGQEINAIVKASKTQSENPNSDQTSQDGE
jgi:hypothetical protein